MTDDSIDHIRNPAHVDASLSMNDRDTIISNMLKAATVENERLRAALNSLRREHYSCDDTFYSCPKHPEDGYKPGSKEYICNCGADRVNATIDAALGLEQKANEK